MAENQTTTQYHRNRNLNVHGKKQSPLEIINNQEIILFYRLSSEVHESEKHRGKQKTEQLKA